MAAVIGAASGGARTFTASSSHGLAYMHEMLHWASAARLPIVMADINRALGPGWNIWTDQTDSLAQRDTGWRIGSELTVKIAQLAVQTNIFPLYEVDGGVKYTLNFKCERGVGDYLAVQGRFKHLSASDYDRIQEMVDNEWKLLMKKAGPEFTH